jgi:hypothetical protein
LLNVFNNPRFEDISLNQWMEFRGRADLRWCQEIWEIMSSRISGF